MGLSREQILGAPDLGITAVDVPEWVGEVFVRMFTLRERLEVLPAITGEGDATAKLLALGVCGEDGGRLFTLADCEALAGKNGEVCQRLALKVLEVNKLGRAEADAAEKNSGSSPSGGSPSA